MASQTSTEGTLEGFDSAQLLDDMTVTQLQRSTQLTGNPIKEHFGHALYNFLIIDPEQVVHGDFAKAYKSAKASAKFGEERLKQSLEGCRDRDGYLQLPSLQEAFDPDFLDDTAVSFLGKAGRAPKPGPALHPDDAAKAILKNVYAVQFSITDAHVLRALEFTHDHGKKVDYGEFKTWMLNQPKQHRDKIFKWPSPTTVQNFPRLDRVFLFSPFHSFRKTSAMSFFADLNQAVREHKRNLQWNPLLQAHLNPFVETKFEEGKAVGMQAALAARFGTGVGARTRYTFAKKTHRNDYESHKHFDKEITARGRFYIYRYHQLDNMTIDDVFGDEELLAQYGYEKKRIARLQTACQTWAMNSALLVVLRSVERGGGFTRWLLSHDLHRKRFWSDAYEPIAFFVDRDFFHWQAHAVNFDAIHGITDDVTLAWRQKNKIVVLELLEATWQYVVSRSPRFDYAVRQVWRNLPTHPEILSLNLPVDAMDIPSNPGGVLGIVRRQEAVRPYGGGGDPMVLDHFPLYSGL